jgi:hypothetical protein
MWRDGSTAQTELAVKRKNNNRQTGEERGIVDVLVLVTKLAR